MEGPIYACTALCGNSAREIKIDVTRSASSFWEPAEDLKAILSKILRNKELGINTVVEFGAGKFRNVPFILKNGKSVCAVEFEKLSTNQISIANLSLSRETGVEFRTMTPENFSSDSQKFDLALLINVLPVVPFLSERAQILELLHSKLNDGKFLLWFAQKEGTYKKIREMGENACEDGIWMGKGRRFHTFYKHYPLDELTGLMNPAGFFEVKRFASRSNDAALYRRD